MLLHGAYVLGSVFFSLFSPIYLLKELLRTKDNRVVMNDTILNLMQGIHMFILLNSVRLMYPTRGTFSIRPYSPLPVEPK